MITMIGERLPLILFLCVFGYGLTVELSHHCRRTFVCLLFWSMDLSIICNLDGHKEKLKKKGRQKESMMYEAVSFWTKQMGWSGSWTSCLFKTELKPFYRVCCCYDTIQSKAKWYGYLCAGRNVC